MQKIMGSLVTISDAIDGWMYSNLLFWALIVAGLFFTIRTKFVQIRLVILRGLQRQS